MISILDFQTKGYVVPMPATNEAVKNGIHHMQLGFQQFASAQGLIKYAPCIYDLTLTAAGAAGDTVFLPYYQDQVASVLVPNRNGATFFVTSNLSGCAIYICKNNADELVVIHSNSQSGSTKTNGETERPSFQTRQAAQELDDYARIAANNHGGALRKVAALTKSVYLSAVDRLARTGSLFLGGTTVAGWRQAGTNNWAFHYQVWGRVGGGAIQLVTSREFYRNY